MIILHGGICENRFFVWAEASPDTQNIDTVKKRGRKKKIPDVMLYPYSCKEDRLVECIRAIGIVSASHKISVQKLIVWIPSSDNKPVPSNPLINGSMSVPVDCLTLKPWKITAVALTIEQVVKFLCKCSGKYKFQSGILIGNDVVFCLTVLRFAGSLVAEQQYLPDVILRNKIYIARWKPVYFYSNKNILNKLANNMPDILRSITMSADSSLNISRISFVSEFINTIVDYLVRSNFPVSKDNQHKKRAVAEHMHDRWISALQSSDGIMTGNADKLKSFAEVVHSWHRPVTLSAESPFRLCFRLEEPEDKDMMRDEDEQITETADKWYIRFLLQSVDDPSLFISITDAFKKKRTSRKIFNQNKFNVTEYILSSLGQASSIFKYFEDSLKTSVPDGHALNTVETMEFLTVYASILEQSGFGVMLPAWWINKGTKTRLSARAKIKSPKMQSAGMLSLSDIIDFNWEIAIGDEKLSYEELERISNLKTSLVKIRGQWVQMSADEIKSALKLISAKMSSKTTLKDIVRMSLGIVQNTDSIAYRGVSASGWISDFLNQLNNGSGFEELSQPDKFQGVLRPYQLRGYSWLHFLKQWGLGACLADDMGLGKTIQTLALLQKDWTAGDKRPVLLICPTSVAGNWHKEAQRFTPNLPVMVHHGIGRKRDDAFIKEAEKYALIISSYAILVRDSKFLQHIYWKGVILDEAQNIKNPETKQSKYAQSLNSDFRIALTGTPIENNVGDLWSIMQFLNPGFLGTQTDFKRKYFIPIQAYKDASAVERLKRITRPFVLRRLKTDKTIISDLPEKMEMKLFSTLTKEQASLYGAVVKDTMKKLDVVNGIDRKGLVLSTLSKLKQVCNHPAHFLGDNSVVKGRSGKLILLTEMLEEIILADERTLIFSQFSKMGEILRKYLQETFGEEVFFLHGAISKKKRDLMVERFQSAENAPHIFVLSLKAGGVGLNLTRANHVFHFDRWWNPSVENQATDRVFRIGQLKNVQVHKFVCIGTMEERIDEMIESKKQLADNIVGTDEGWLTELSTAELKDIFKLRKTAVKG